MASGSQHGRPVIHRTGHPPVVLQPVKLGQSGSDDGHREAFLQTLVHEQPDIIPMEDIEPAFRPLISVCTELPTSAGSVDNLWITPEGGLILGECKLVRNPQSRREVIAQALDYARAVTGWHFDDLQNAIRKTRNEPSFSLWGLVEHQTNLQEEQFVDAVERRLRFGRLMILVIGDGIHEGTEALTEFLQLHAGVHAGLALVDLSIWKGHGEDLLIVPRVPLKTVLVERGIVLFDGVNVKIEPPRRAKNGPVTTTASETEFFSQLEQRLPGLSEPLRAFISSLAPLGVDPDFGKSLFLRWQDSNGTQISVGTIEPNGSIWLLKSVTDARSAGNQAAAERYLTAIAKLTSGSIKRYGNGSIDVRGHDDRSLRLQALIGFAPEWKDAIEELINSFQGSPTNQ